MLEVDVIVGGPEFVPKGGDFVLAKVVVKQAVQGLDGPGKAVLALPGGLELDAVQGVVDEMGLMRLRSSWFSR